MTAGVQNRGGAPVGVLGDMAALEAATVVYLRLWSDGQSGREAMRSDLITMLGASRGQAGMQAFDDLCTLFARHGRRPLMRHALKCKCLGADESCFANFVAAAAQGAREDAMLIATLLVRPDVAGQVVALAEKFGLALRCMGLRAPAEYGAPTKPQPTLH